MADMSEVTKVLGGLEASIDTLNKKADEQIRLNGEASKDTKAALDNVGKEQHALALRLLALEQKNSTQSTETKADSWGEQFVKSASYTAFREGAKSASFEVKNTITNAIGATYSERKPGVVAGAQLPVMIEQILASTPTSAPSITYIKENVFTNAAAEVAEGAAKPQSSLTFTEVTDPVQCVAHWLKVTKQLAADNAAVMAYINFRMRYGLDLRVDGQLISGNGTSPNLSGLMKAGNFTPHGFTAAGLGAGFTAFDVIRRTMAARYAAGYPATGVIVNPADWASMELIKDTQGRYILGDPSRAAAATLWGLPVYQSISMAAGSFLLGNFGLAATKYDREGVSVGMYEQDENNVQLNLVTIRAERRLCLAVDTPAAMSGGLLAPA
jgi:HK97 family phage major capsid protein